MTRPTLGSIREGAQALQAEGRVLLTTLFATIQTLKLYPLENEAVQNALDDLHRVVQRILAQEGMVELRLSGDFLFLNDSRLRFDFSNYLAFSSVTSALNRHKLGSVEIDPGVDRAEWAPFLTYLVGNPGSAPDPFVRFNELLAASPVRHIRVGPERAREDDDEAREAAKRTYVQAVHVTREVLTDMRLGKAVNARRIKRAIQSIVDQVLANENSILGMTTLRDYDEYTFTHSVNVCIFSIVLGQKLGLSKLQLYELGLGALFHDLGKMRIDPSVINKPTALTEEETELIRQHPTEGLLSLFWVHGFGEVPYRAMLVAYEHHMKVDLTGYPINRRPRQPTLFSRIVAVADAFDAATSKRSYQSLPWRPEDVLREMRDNRSRGYDPLLVKAFINATGVFPIGTLVILDTYELAVVVAPNPDREKIHQPMVKIIADSLGLPLADPPLVDLSELDPTTGQPRRTIIKTTDPEKYGIRVADYFL